MNYLLVKDIIIGYNKNADIKNSVPASASCITECLLIHDTGEGGIKKVNDRNDAILDTMKCFFHELPKISTHLAVTIGKLLFLQAIIKLALTISKRNEFS